MEVRSSVEAATAMPASSIERMMPHGELCPNVWTTRAVRLKDSGPVVPLVRFSFRAALSNGYLVDQLLVCPALCRFLRDWFVGGCGTARATHENPSVGIKSTVDDQIGQHLPSGTLNAERIRRGDGIV